MARRQLTYTELRVALFVLATVALLIVGIFYVTGQGAWQAKYPLKTYLPEAEGVVEGAPVSLGGVHVGNVSSLRINPDAKTPDQNIEVNMDIFKKYQDWIRENSTATLVTQGALGSRYVTITRGTPPALSSRASPPPPSRPSSRIARCSWTISTVSPSISARLPIKSIPARARSAKCFTATGSRGA